MKELPKSSSARAVRMSRRIALTMGVALAAVLLLVLAVASLAQASGVERALPMGRAYSPPVITPTEIIESSPYLHADETLFYLYYSDEMGAVNQNFSLAGLAAGTELDYVECSAAFGEGPFTDPDPSGGWLCGPYRVQASNNGDGVITATLHNITGEVASTLFLTFEDLLPPDSEASSPPYANAMPIAVDWSADDGDGNVSGPDETCLWVKFESGNWQNTGLCQEGSGGTFAYDSSGADDGTFYFQTVSTDNVGNEESPAAGDGDSATLLDRAAPIVTVEAPTTTSQLSWLVEWSAVDPPPGSGIDVYDVFYRVGDGGWVTWYEGVDDTPATFGPISPVPVYHGESYSFYVRAYDRAGNAGDSPVVTTEVKLTPLHIPVLLRGYAPLTNGGFEEGWAGWTHGGELAQSISSEDTHSGSYAARLGNPGYVCTGGVPLGRAWLERTFMIPSSGASTLRIWYRIWSEDKLKGDEFDRFEIWFNGDLVLRDGNESNIYGCSQLPQSEGWESLDIDVVAYAGQSVTLRLENWNWALYPSAPGYDWFNTWTYVDDIQLLP